MSLSARQQYLIDQAQRLMASARQAEVEGDQIAHIALLTAATELCKLASWMGEAAEARRSLH
jgi:hypothetical protein